MVIRPLAFLVILAAVALGSACAPRFDAQLVRSPIADRRWVSTEHRTHPLVGRIWDTRAERFVDESALAAALASADFVLLGETHDNPDHHLLQARLLSEVIASGRRPAVAFEMLNADQQETIDAARAGSPHDPDALGSAVRWDASGWPEFQWYRPIFQAALEAGLPVVAANLPRAQVKEIVSKGQEGLDDALRVRLAREEPLPDAVMTSLREEMKESHCGELPAPMLDPLVLAQRARDARMAERMASAGAERGAVLIAGLGHARTDRGVPALLAKDAPGRKVIAVAMLEVARDAREPSRYAKQWGAGPLPFDFAVFTPGAKRDDPCAGFRRKLEKRRAADGLTSRRDQANAIGRGELAGRATSTGAAITATGARSARASASNTARVITGGSVERSATTAAG